MEKNGTAQNKPKSLKQPYFNAKTTQARANAFCLNLWEKREGRCVHKKA